jgi:hypothetical protein
MSLPQIDRGQRQLRQPAGLDIPAACGHAAAFLLYTEARL